MNPLVWTFIAFRKWEDCGRKVSAVGCSWTCYAWNKTPREDFFLLSHWGGEVLRRLKTILRLGCCCFSSVADVEALAESHQQDQMFQSCTSFAMGNNENWALQTKGDFADLICCVIVIHIITKSPCQGFRPAKQELVRELLMGFHRCPLILFSALQCHLQ